LEKYWGIMLQSKEIYNKLQTSRKKMMAGVILCDTWTKEH
jgi:hypothetical protein